MSMIRWMVCTLIHIETMVVMQWVTEPAAFWDGSSPRVRHQVWPWQWPRDGSVQHRPYDIADVDAEPGK